MITVYEYGDNSVRSRPTSAAASEPRRTQGLATNRCTDLSPPTTYNMLNRSASSAAGNHYDKIDTSRAQRPTSDEYLKPDHYDYIAMIPDPDPQHADATAAGFKVVYHK